MHFFYVFHCLLKQDPIVIKYIPNENIKSLADIHIFQLVHQSGGAWFVEISAFHVSWSDLEYTLEWTMFQCLLGEDNSRFITLQEHFQDNKQIFIIFELLLLSALNFLWHRDVLVDLLNQQLYYSFT